jgi:DnaJ-class molecular chaperone with C-terminal Zn finger domain
MRTPQIHNETIREGAAEVREKLKSDLSSVSRLVRVRRFVSLSPTMTCPTCDGRREETCAACGGSGRQKVVWNDQEIVCEGCKGTTTQACGECFGRGRVKNIHRKKFLTLLCIGGLAWAFIVFQLWGRDVLPEQSAKYLHGGGGGGAAQVRTSTHTPGRLAPAALAPTQPNSAVAQPGAVGQSPDTSNPAPPPNDSQGGSPVSPRGGQLAPRGGRMLPGGQ